MAKPWLSGKELGCPLLIALEELWALEDHHFYHWLWLKNHIFCWNARNGSESQYIIRCPFDCLKRLNADLCSAETVVDWMFRPFEVVFSPMKVHLFEDIGLKIAFAFSDGDRRSITLFVERYVYYWTNEDMNFNNRNQSIPVCPSFLILISRLTRS